MWCFSDLYFSSKSGSGPQEKPLTSWTPVSLANTNKNTCIASLDLAKSILSHLVTKRTLIWCWPQKLSCPEVHVNEDCGIEWKPGQEGLLLPEVWHALPGHTEGWRYCPHPDGQHLPQSWDRPQNSKGTAMTTPLGKEVSERHRALDAIQRSNQKSWMHKLPFSSLLKMRLGRWHSRFYLQGLEEANCRQMFNNNQVNDV